MPDKRCAVAAALLACSPVLIAQEEMPEIEFLEYLGFWEASDEDWIMFVAVQDEGSDTEKRNDPAPQGKVSAETDDEE